MMFEANSITSGQASAINTNLKFIVFSLGETNALIIFTVEYNLLISTGTFALRFDLVPSQMSVSPVLCIINKM